MTAAEKRIGTWVREQEQARAAEERVTAEEQRRAEIRHNAQTLRR